MVKKALVFLICMAVAGAAAARTLYRIELRGQVPVVATDAPVTHGTILVFRSQADGRLTGVPQEDVVSVTPVAASASISGTSALTSTRKARVTAVRTTTAPAKGEPMKPGETLVLGPTGGDGSVRASGAANAKPGGQPGTTAPGSPGYPGAVGPNGVPVAATNAPGSVDPNLGLQPPAASTVGTDGLPRAASGPPPTIDPVTGRPPTSPPVAASTANPAGSTAPTTTTNPAGTTPSGTTTNPAGTTPSGTTLQPVQPGAAGQAQTPPQQTGTAPRPNSGPRTTGATTGSGNRGAGTGTSSNSNNSSTSSNSNNSSPN